MFKRNHFCMCLFFPWSKRINCNYKKNCLENSFCCQVTIATTRIIPLCVIYVIFSWTMVCGGWSLGDKKGGFVKGGFGEHTPRSGFRSGRTYECTLVPLFVPSEHLNVPSFGFSSRGTSAKITLLETTFFVNPRVGLP